MIGMHSEQLLKQEPLKLEQSMILPWRMKNNLLTSHVSENQVREELDMLKNNDETEHRALLRLAGNAKVHGHGGLPLAIAQAGCFVYKMCITFITFARHIPSYIVRYERRPR